MAMYIRKSNLIFLKFKSFSFINFLTQQPSGKFRSGLTYTQRQATNRQKKLLTNPSEIILYDFIMEMGIRIDNYVKSGYV